MICENDEIKKNNVEVENQIREAIRYTTTFAPFGEIKNILFTITNQDTPLTPSI